MSDLLVCPYISIVIPVFNEAHSLNELLEKILVSIAQNQFGPVEVIFVDDGSTDDSWSIIQKLHNLNGAYVKGLKLRRNFGKSTALAAGFEIARGEIIFTMDADLQDDPSEIPKFLQKIGEGFHLVSGWKEKRHDPWHKTIPSKIFNAVVRSVFQLKLHDFNCGFKVYRKEVLQAVSVYGELHRFIPVLANHVGFKIAEVSVRHHPRKFGSSKYGMDRFIKGALDLLTILATTRFRQRPAHLFGSLGILSGISGFGILAYLSIFKWVTGESIGQRPLLFLGILLTILSAQLISLGILAELIFKNSPRPSLEFKIDQTLE